VADAEEGTFIL